MGLAPFVWLTKPAEALNKFRVNLPGAILIHGPRGSGTFELANAFARSLLCSSPIEGAPCGECPECKLLEAGNHPDFKLLLSEAEEAIHPLPWQKEEKTVTAKKSLSRQISIEQIRSLSEFVSTSSRRGGRKVVLIYPADTMMADQSSALLKTLEEPPAGVIFLLVSDNLDSMLPTIRSRCQIVRVTPPTPEQGCAFLKAKNVEHPEEMLAKFGGMPLLYFEEDVKLKIDEKKEEILLDLLAKGKNLDSRMIIELTASDFPLLPFLTLMQRCCVDLILMREGLNARYFLRRKEQIKSASTALDLRKMYGFVDELAQNKRHAQIALNARLIEQDLLMKYKNCFVN